MGFGGGIKWTPADKYFSLWIRYRDNWTCQVCFAKKPPRAQIGGSGLENSHFFGRRGKNTRFDPENCDALCSSCHNHMGSNPNDYRDWKHTQLGDARYKALVLRGHAARADKLDWKLEAAKWRKALREQGIDC